MCVCSAVVVWDNFDNYHTTLSDSALFLQIDIYTVQFLLKQCQLYPISKHYNRDDFNLRN